MSGAATLGTGSPRASAVAGALRLPGAQGPMVGRADTMASTTMAPIPIPAAASDEWVSVLPRKVSDAYPRRERKRRLHIAAYPAGDGGEKRIVVYRYAPIPATI